MKTSTAYTCVFVDIDFVLLANEPEQLARKLKLGGWARIAD